MNWIQPVAMHLIGADRGDLTYLRDVEEGRVVAPKATILALNEAHVYIETAGIRDDLRGFLFRTSRGRPRRPAFRRAHHADRYVAWSAVAPRRRDRRADRLPHVPGYRHHRVFGEWRHAGARTGDGGARKPAHDQALRPHAGTAHARGG